jgi:predicted nucleic acid-binding protein
VATVYLETSFISACVTTRSDIASAYRRQISQEWWQTQASRHVLNISQEVVTELSSPRYPRRDEALALIQSIPLLAVTDDVLGLAAILVRQKVMPAPVAGDAIHIATAAIHGIEYVLSWNVRHLANPNKLTHLRAVCLRVGLVPPQIVTPDLLWESSDEPEQ